MQKPIPETIARLSEEHLEARRILNALDRQIDAAAQYRAPDLEAIRGAALFFQSYTTRHDAMETLVHAALTRSNQNPADAAQLSREHAAAAAVMSGFIAAMDGLAENTDKARRDFCEAAREFLMFQRAHIRRAETRFFVYAVHHLNDEDWKAIDAAICGGEQNRKRA